MNQHATSQLLTCRYWALGPFCPNVDGNGVTYCKFAHRDTGKLASSFLQRGTCRLWMQHGCPYGPKCWFEHRHTGVSGLNQGVLILTGINLEIADAAYASNFDTRNHEALMNLIWSVKRVILRNDRPNGNVLPPKDPIYPDKYRPSGIGDNTGRKRRRISERSSPPPFQTVHPLGSSNKRGRNKKRNKKKIARRLTVDASGLHKVLNNAKVTKSYTLPTRFKTQAVKRERGTRYEPIDLLDDTGEENDRYKSTSANTSATGHNVATSIVINKQRPKSSPKYGRDNVLPQAENLLNSLPICHANITAEIATVLKAVKYNLTTVQMSMQQCQLTMKALFNKNSVHLGGDGIFTIISKLSDEIYRAYDSAKDGIVVVDASLQWLIDGGHHVKDEGVL